VTAIAPDSGTPYPFILLHLGWNDANQSSSRSESLPFPPSHLPLRRSFNMGKPETKSHKSSPPIPIFSCNPISVVADYLVSFSAGEEALELAEMATAAVMATHSELHRDSIYSSAKEELTSPTLPSLKHGGSFNLTDTADDPAAVANGAQAPARASPSPNILNGKPTSPYSERGNPMGHGASQTVSSKDPKAAAQAANDMRNVVRRKLTGYVGFANLPNQWHRKSVRKGFNFNVMVVGKQ